MQVNYKLLKAASGLGFNYSEVISLLEVSEITPIASWAFDKETGEGKILVNPDVLKFPLFLIRLILRHEILHYAGYNEIGEISNHDLMNIMLDVAVNRILHLAYPKEMEKLSKRIYPDESKKTVLALAQCTLQHEAGEIDKLKPKIRRAYTEIWDSNEVPSPISLYYQFLIDSTKKAKKQNPFGGRSKGTGSQGKKAGSPKKETGKQGKKTGSQKKSKSKKEKSSVDKELNLREIPKDIKTAKDEEILDQAYNQIFKIKEEATYSRNYWDRREAIKAFSNAASKLFQKILVKKKAGLDVKKVSDFINRLNLRRQLEEALDPLMLEASSASRRQLYPYRLSRLGTIYAACGISDLIPFFWNKTPESQKLSVAIYIDTSPSMDWAKEYEVFLIDKLKEVFPAKIFAFAGSVEEISAREFAEGNYPKGYSTSFDSVVKHFLERKDEFALVFTDGQSNINSENKQGFRESKKKLFAIYFDSYSDKVQSDLDNLASNAITLKLPRGKQ